MGAAEKTGLMEGTIGAAMSGPVVFPFLLPFPLLPLLFLFPLPLCTGVEGEAGVGVIERGENGGGGVTGGG
jgi:hypothetical protein